MKAITDTHGNRKTVRMYTNPPMENGSDCNLLSSTFRVVRLLKRPEIT